MKIFSAYTTGGSYESLGFGYGPGIGDGYDRLIMIVSRASGAPVIAGAMEFATNLVKHNWKKIADDEFAKAKKAGFEAIIDELKEYWKERSSSGCSCNSSPQGDLYCTDSGYRGYGPGRRCTGTLERGNLRRKRYGLYWPDRSDGCG